LVESASSNVFTRRDDLIPLKEDEDQEDRVVVAHAYAYKGFGRGMHVRQMIFLWTFNCLRRGQCTKLSHDMHIDECKNERLVRCLQTDQDPRTMNQDADYCSLTLQCP
jgi:hypothetical protein